MSKVQIFSVRSKVAWKVIDPGAAEFSRRRRIFDVRRKSAEKFGLAAIRRRRKKIGGGFRRRCWNVVVSITENVKDNKNYIEKTVYSVSKVI